jgi:hypothetical protein
MGFAVSYQPSSGITAKDGLGDEGIYDFLKIVAPEGNRRVSYTPSPG